MRLLKRLAAMELRLRGAAAAPGVALVWTADDVRLSEEELAGAVHVALDVYITGEVRGTQTWRTVQRVAASAEDLGCVYDAGGVLMGRVTAVDKSGLVSWSPTGV